jgi:N utilization substance protein B
MNPSSARPPRRGVTARRAARLAAVQALYQMEIADQSAPAVIADFKERRLGLGPEGEPGEDADADLFAAIVEGVVAHQTAIDSVLSGVLAKGWRLDRIESIARAILRAGGFELQERKDAPAAGIIEAYVDLAHQFLDAPAPGFINGALDAAARQTRPGELPARPN